MLSLRSTIASGAVATLLLAGSSASGLTFALDLGTDAGDLHDAVAGGNPGDLCLVEPSTCQDIWKATDAHAGDVIKMTWNLDGSQIEGPDGIPDFPWLRARGDLTVTSITLDTVVLDVTLYNQTGTLNTNLPGLEASIVSFGVLLDGFVSGVLSTAGSFLDTYDTDNIAGGAGLRTDFCASTSIMCNQGSVADGISIGGSDTFQFTLSGVFDPIAGITLRHFATKWQTNPDDEELFPPADDPDVIGSGSSSIEQPGLPGNIPEPSTALLMAIGLVGLGWVGRRG